MNDILIEDREPFSKYLGAQPFVGSDISDESFTEIRDILFSARGFDLDGYKDRCIKRRIAARIRTLDFHHIEAYIDLLKNNDLEQEFLLEALTIHVSQFFRNPTTFSVLEETLLPELLHKHRGTAEVKVWSVGCAGGEEPYSIALLGDELCGPSDHISILGTDVSADILKKARAGIYDSHRLVEVPDPVLTKYFSKEGVRYRLDERIRNKVRFLRHDILQDRFFPRIDLILCRNILIYFSRPEQDRILRTLAKSLAPDGLLILGRAESMVNESRDLFVCVDPAERIYRKRDKEASSL